MEKIYSIVSGKGGVGKTVSAINLAAALNSLGQNTLLVDANISTPNIGLHLGAPIVPVTLNHVLNGKAEIEDAIYKHQSGLKIIPSSLSIDELRKIKHEKMQDAIKQLKYFANSIVLDSSAGLGIEAAASIMASDEAILVTQAEIPAVTDALKTAKWVEQLGKKVRGFIVTRHTGRKTEMPIENIIDLLELPILGVVPEDKNMQKALILRNPIFYAYPRSIASKAYRRIANRLLGHEEKPGFFSKLFGSY